jgi:hypothetical protein
MWEEIKPLINEVRIAKFFISEYCPPFVKLEDQHIYKSL